MKLIHCADLHLDSPMESNLSAEQARERKNELRATFARLVRYAEEIDAVAVLIAGDLFDSHHVTGSTQNYVLDLIAAHPTIRFFYLTGNHDRGNDWKRSETLPKNLFLFRDGWTTYSIDNVAITGSERPNSDTLQLNPDALNILLLHGQERGGNGTAREDVIHLGKLRGKHVDYVALGHIHEYRTATVDERCLACYSGCLEGRGFDECGPKGFVLLETSGQKILHRFIPFATRQLHTVPVDLSDLTSQWALEQQLLHAVEELPSSDLVKVVLTGTCPTDAVPDLLHLRQILSERFYFAKLTDESHIRIHPEDYRNDISLKGEFIRHVMRADLNEQEKERIIACGLRALAGEETGL